MLNGATAWYRQLQRRLLGSVGQAEHGLLETVEQHHGKQGGANPLPCIMATTDEGAQHATARPAAVLQQCSSLSMIAKRQKQRGIPNDMQELTVKTPEATLPLPNYAGRYKYAL